MNPTRILLAACAATSLLASGAPAAASKPGAMASYLRPVVPFIEDDYDGALAQARARKLPLFIEAWAPW